MPHQFEKFSQALRQSFFFFSLTYKYKEEWVRDLKAKDKEIVVTFFQQATNHSEINIIFKQMHKWQCKRK